VELTRGSGGGDPLRDATVVVTRAEEQANALAEPLRKLGAQVLLVPTIRIVPVPVDGEMRAAIESLEEYDVVIFSSANAVRHFLDRVDESGRSAASLARATVVAVGPKTAAALAQRGVHTDVVPTRYVAEGIVEALAQSGLRPAGKRVLIPRAREAREVVPQALAEQGARVNVLPVYETVLAETLPVPAQRIETADFITFTSGSCVEGFVALMGQAELAQRLAHVRLCSIGPVTSEALRRHGLPVAVEARPYTVEGLVAAIVRCVAG